MTEKLSKLVQFRATPTLAGRIRQEADRLGVRQSELIRVMLARLLVDSRDARHLTPPITTEGSDATSD